MTERPLAEWFSHVLTVEAARALSLKRGVTVACWVVAGGDVIVGFQRESDADSKRTMVHARFFVSMRDVLCPATVRKALGEEVASNFLEG
jgi:hypothetical protein